MNRLEEKKWLKHLAKGRTFIYYPTRKREETLETLVGDIHSRIFKGSSSDLVRCLFRSVKMSKTEIKKLKEIIKLYPYSPDAKYLIVQIKFQNGQKKKAITDLVDLIKDSGEYYGKTLIDPELGPFMDHIQPQLKKLYEEAKDSAETVLKQAEEEMSRFTETLGEEAEKSDSIQSLWKKTRDLFKLDSYLGYLECAKSSSMIIRHCREYVAGRRRKVEKLIANLNARCSEYLDYTKKFPYKKYSHPVHETLRSFQKNIDQAGRKARSDTPSNVVEAFNQVLTLADQLEEMPTKLSNLENIRKSYLFISSFFKFNILLQSINVVIGIILFPLIIHYLQFIFPKLESVNQKLRVSKSEDASSRNQSSDEGKIFKETNSNVSSIASLNVNETNSGLVRI